MYTFKGGQTRFVQKSTVSCVEVKEHIDQHIPYIRGNKMTKLNLK